MRWYMGLGFGVLRVWGQGSGFVVLVAQGWGRLGFGVVRVLLYFGMSFCSVQGLELQAYLKHLCRWRVRDVYPGIYQTP